MSLVEVKALRIEFETQRGLSVPVQEVDFSLEQGKTLGIVGESGCGKSLTSLALMGLLPPQAKLSAKRLDFDGESLLSLSERKRRALRGSKMAMIFQDPMSALNPSFSVGFQLMEVIKAHRSLTRREREEEAIQLLSRVGISDAKIRLQSFPHQLSGGMCQRIMIAMAMASRPKLLIADEPTTALDVTIQNQILSLLRELQESEQLSLILITHDIAVVGEVADEISVMYAGEVVENASAEKLILSPRHPYTEGLLRCLPSANRENKAKLSPIAGLVPDTVNRDSRCQFFDRCSYATEKCQQPPKLEVLGGRRVRCFFPVSRRDVENA